MCDYSAQDQYQVFYKKYPYQYQNLLENSIAGDTPVGTTLPRGGVVDFRRVPSRVGTTVRPDM